MTRPIAEYDVTPGKLMDSIKPWAGRGNIYGVSISHDNGCPCLEEGRSFWNCTCEIVHVVVVKL